MIERSAAMPGGVDLVPPALEHVARNTTPDLGRRADAFWAAGDYRYVLVAAPVLVIIAASIAIGRGG